MGCNSSKQSKVSDVVSTKQAAAAENSPNEEIIDEKKIDQNMLTVPEPKPMSRTSTPASAVVTEDQSYEIIRLLLLGSAESGKTTLLEQVRLLYKQHFTESEIFHRRAFIYNNVFKCIKYLVAAMRDNNCEYADPINAGRAQSILEDIGSHFGLFASDMVEKIKYVWKDAGIQKLYARRSMFNLNDSAAYFLNNIDKINRTDYMPTEKDLIMSYVPTVGVQNVIFTTNKQSFQLFDIGGQKIDRRKWATMYDGIDAIFFCLAISEYDQVMNEDLKTNRFDDALILLKKISKEPKFEKTTIYLFLNEVDVFCEKLSEMPLQDYKTTYNGSTKEDALDFIQHLAVQALDDRDKNLYKVYRTVAIDTQMMAEILAGAFKDIIKKKK